MVYLPPPPPRFRGKISKSLRKRLEGIIEEAEDSASSSLKNGEFFIAYDALRSVVSQLERLVS